MKYRPDEHPEIQHRGRSREGAWIEIGQARGRNAAKAGRSREGAWIEICTLVIIAMRRAVAPVRERGLKFWIFSHFFVDVDVAPVRERGLKSSVRVQIDYNFTVAPVRERGLKCSAAMQQENFTASLP